MNDVLELPVRINLDLHFGRLSPLTTNPEQRGDLIYAATHLIQYIDEGLLSGKNDDWIDSNVQRYVFDKKNALPHWLVNKTLIACDNSMARFEATVCDILCDPFNRRRFLDYLCSELTFYSWLWSDDDMKRNWVVKRTADLCENAFCIKLNTYDYVQKLNNSVLGTERCLDDDLYRWYISSLGSVNLVDFTTKPIYEYTVRLLAARYKTSFILDVFKKLFADTYRAQGLGHWGILILGDIPKMFCLADFMAQDACCRSLSHREPGVTDLLWLTLKNFDAPGACRLPEARFRLGNRPPQALTERVGARFWLRRTLDQVKRIQQQKATCQQGLRIEERSFLTQAMKQQCILYCNLFDDQVDPEINPCSIQSIHEEGMVLQSPKGNKLNTTQEGQEIHGYFSIVDGKRKSTYCDFRTSVRSLRPGSDGTALVDIAFPAAFELTRRSHKRLRLGPDRLKGFFLSVPPADADWTSYSNLDNWPNPLCQLPDTDGLYEIKDLSAGGLMLEVHQDTPAFDFFIEDNRDINLLAFLHLAGRQNLPDLRLPLRLRVKRIRHFAPLHKKYLGVQFIGTGEIKNEKYVRWQPVGKEGVFLIADWIFRDSVRR
jgi:hypothetical protein